VATLYLVSTPIGNLEDLSPRAVRVLRSSSRILAEDTRRSRILADHAGATGPLVSVREHNEESRTGQILGWLENGEDMALVTDAGTPLVSDPGARVVRAVVQAGHTVTPIPGPSAALAALVASGLPAERFVFIGFPARKGQDRQSDLVRVAESMETVILFESPNRLVRLLEDLNDLCKPGRGICVAREVTKIHEEFLRGSISDAIAHFREHPPRGEVTVVVAPDDKVSNQEHEVERARAVSKELLDSGHSASSVVQQVVQGSGLARNLVYRIVHDLKDSEKER
jgi:16S rRNA (cytidine1402-2'-O)-methyltransferase